MKDKLELSQISETVLNRLSLITKCEDKSEMVGDCLVLAEMIINAQLKGERIWFDKGNGNFDELRLDFKYL